MDKFLLECVEVDTDHDSFAVVRFAVKSADPTIYSDSGTFGIQIASADGFEVGATYNVRLEKEN